MTGPWPYDAPAAALSGTELGAQVEFLWFFTTSNVEAKVIGEIREIHHSFTGDVDLFLLGDTDGGHTPSHFRIPRDRTVRVLTEGYEP